MDEIYAAIRFRPYTGSFRTCVLSLYLFTLDDPYVCVCLLVACGYIWSSKEAPATVTNTTKTISLQHTHREREGGRGRGRLHAHKHHYNLSRVKDARALHRVEWVGEFPRCVVPRREVEDATQSTRVHHQRETDAPLPGEISFWILYGWPTRDRNIK